MHGLYYLVTSKVCFPFAVLLAHQPLQRMSPPICASVCMCVRVCRYVSRSEKLKDPAGGALRAGDELFVERERFNLSDSCALALFGEGRHKVSHKLESNGCLCSVHSFGLDPLPSALPNWSSEAT